MSQPDRYFIGPGLRVKLRQTIDKVDGMTIGGGGPTIPTRLQSMPQPGGSPLRICTFTGAWSVNGSKTVTLRGATTTFSAVNLFSNITVDCGLRNCAIAKNGTAWYLIAAQCS